MTDWSMLAMVEMMVAEPHISCTRRQVYRPADISPAGQSGTEVVGRSTAGEGSDGRTGTAAVWPPDDTGQQRPGRGCTVPWSQSRTSGWALGRTAAWEHLDIAPGQPPPPLAGRTAGGWRNISAPQHVWEHSRTPRGRRANTAVSEQN